MLGKREVIQMPKWYIVIGIFSVTFGFGGLILFSNWMVRDYQRITGSEEISPITLTGNEDFGGGLRGAVFYKSKRFIYEAILIDISCSNENEFKQFGIDPKTLTFLDHRNLKFKLSDLQYPYNISKGKDSIIHVKKKSCKLKFRLSKFEGDK